MTGETEYPRRSLGEISFIQHTDTWYDKACDFGLLSVASLYNRWRNRSDWQNDNDFSLVFGKISVLISAGISAIIIEDFREIQGYSAVSSLEFHC
jgi:hypothetical protein